MKNNLRQWCFRWFFFLMFEYVCTEYAIKGWKSKDLQRRSLDLICWATTSRNNLNPGKSCSCLGIDYSPESISRVISLLTSILSCMFRFTQLGLALGKLDKDGLNTIAYNLLQYENRPLYTFISVQIWRSWKGYNFPAHMETASVIGDLPSRQIKTRGKL